MSPYANSRGSISVTAESFKNLTTFSRDANAPVPTHEKQVCRSSARNLDQSVCKLHSGRQALELTVVIKAPFPIR